MNNFKIGQKVIIKKIRRIGVIERRSNFDPNNNWAVRTLDDIVYSCSESELKLLPEKKEKIKVGDTVEIVECRYNSPDHIGKIGKIQRRCNIEDYFDVYLEGDQCCTIEVKKVEKLTPAQRVSKITIDYLKSECMCTPLIHFLKCSNVNDCNSICCQQPKEDFTHKEGCNDQYPHRVPIDCKEAKPTLCKCHCHHASSRSCFSSPKHFVECKHCKPTSHQISTTDVNKKVKGYLERARIIYLKFTVNEFGRIETGERYMVITEIAKMIQREEISYKI